MSDAGGSNTASVKVYKDISPAEDGKLHLEFKALLKEKPLISGIEIVPASDGVIHPIRILAAEKGYVSPAGHVVERQPLRARRPERPEAG